MREATRWLTAVKDRPVLPLPAGGEPETLEELMVRVDADGHRAAISRRHYFEVLERNGIALRLPLHAVTHSHEWSVLRLWWLEGGKAYGLKFTAAEMEEFADLWRVAELLRRQRKPVNVVGYGPFTLLDLVAGEKFLDEQGEVYTVSRRQTSTPDVDVWEEPDTIRAHRLLMHPTARVFALTPEQERKVRRRLAARLRRRRV